MNNMKALLVLTAVISVAFAARLRRAVDTVDTSVNDADKPVFEVADSSNEYSFLEDLTCQDSPCMNGGICFSSEDPFKWGFYCFCPPNIGGRVCEVVDPCTKSPCPQDGAICRRSITRPIGRFCFDKDFKLLEE